MQADVLCPPSSLYILQIVSGKIFCAEKYIIHHRQCNAVYWKVQNSSLQNSARRCSPPAQLSWARSLLGVEHIGSSSVLQSPPLWWILMPSQYFLFRSFFDGNCFCNGSPLKAFICPISRTSYRNKSGAPLYWGILLPVCWVRMQSEFYFSSPVSCSCSTTLHCTRFCGWIPYRGWNTFNAPLS